LTKDLLSEHLILLADLLERPPTRPLSIDRLTRGSGRVELEPSDDLAAAHYQIFCHEMMPAGSVFLDPKGMMGGAISDDAWTHMHEHGFEPDTSSILADHLSNELRFLDYLLSEGSIEAAQTVLHSTVMGWLPVFMDRLSAVEHADLSKISDMLGDVILEIGMPELGRVSKEDARAVPVSTFSLDDGGTGLAAIGEFFSTHAESGLFIPKSRLAIEARRHRLPTGFGSKARTIEGLFRSAAQYDSLKAILDFLEGEVEAHVALWETWSQRGVQHWPEAWTEKLLGTSNILKELRQAGV